MPLNSFAVDLRCPHCDQRIPAERTPLNVGLGEEPTGGYRIGDPVPVTPFDLEESFLTTFRPRREELHLLLRWSCEHCRSEPVAEVTVTAGRLSRVETADLTPHHIRRAHEIEEMFAEDLYGRWTGGAPSVARALKPGWALRLESAMLGQPPPITEAVRVGMKGALETLRQIQWVQPLDERVVDAQLDCIRDHLDAVSHWLRAANRPKLWPWFQPRQLLEPNPEIMRLVLAQLAGEPWWTRLPADVPAKVHVAEWLEWRALDVLGEIPLNLADPFEPLVRAFQLGGYVRKSRKLRNELEVGHVTLRIPESMGEWPYRRPTPSRTSLFSPRTD